MSRGARSVCLPAKAGSPEGAPIPQKYISDERTPLPAVDFVHLGKHN